MFRVPTVMRGLRRGVRQALPDIKVAEGMHTAIVALFAQGYRLGIVTSNSKANVEKFLKNNNLEYFDFIQAGARLFGKKSAIKKAVAKNHLEDDAPVFVGDEIRDIEAARKNHMTAVGVTWGLNSRAGLESSQPDFIVDTAEELLAIMRK
jgi:phosphoglycolate phosphatase-like HAD superfamily hydrolase